MSNLPNLTCLSIRNYAAGMRYTPRVVLTWLLLTLTCAEAMAATKTITVAADGSGDFTTVQAAIDAAGASEAAPVDVIIQPGTYDSEMITTRDWVNLIGVDRDRCILQYTRTEDVPVHRAHVVWATSNSTLRNLTLIGGDVKYCIHSDGGGPYVLTIDNCVLRRTADGMAFGIGLQADQHIFLTNCTVEAKLPVFCHNAQNTAQPCSMTISDSVLIGRDRTVHIFCMGSKQTDYYVIHDTVMRAAETGVWYENAGPIKSDPDRKGNDDFRLLGSGNTHDDTAALAAGAKMIDDTNDRQTGLQRARATKPRHGLAGAPRLEDYGSAAGRLVEPTLWRVTAPDHAMALDVAVTDDSIVYTRKAEESFGLLSGPGGANINTPLIMEWRMRFTPGEGDGHAELHYCLAPRSWMIVWRGDHVVDGKRKNNAVELDTSQWHTYRLVATSPQDVRLFIDDTHSLTLEPGSHKVAYFQGRIVGKGAQVELAHTSIRTLD